MTITLNFDGPTGSPHWLTPGHRRGATPEQKARQRARWRAERLRDRLRAFGSASSGNYGHVGRPGKVGGSGQGWQRPAGLDAAVTPKEDAIRNDAVETALVFTEQGQLLHTLTSDSVDYVYVKDDIPIKDTVFVHNHPGGNAFSIQDMHLATTRNIREMRVPTKDGDYVMTRLDATWPRTLMDEALLTADEVRGEFTDKMQRGVMTLAQANARHYDEVWKRTTQALRKQGGPRVEYRFEPKH